MPAAAQELKDPGFETPGPVLTSTSDAPSGKAQISGTVADGWQDNSNWADVKIAYSLDSEHPHGGALCQKIDVQRGFAQFVQPVTFGAGRYGASLWMRAEPAQWVSLTLRLSRAPYTVFATQPAKIGSRWTQVSVVGATPQVAGFVMVGVSGTGTVWLDDAALTRPGPSPGQTLMPPSGAIPRAYFGLNANHMHDAPGYAWPALDVGAYRTWDSGVIWPAVEPRRGAYDWKNLDKDVAQSQAHHAQFLFTLGQTPAWASSRPAEPAVYGKGLAAPPAHIQDWKDFVRAVATRYRGRIGAYEVWNEPDEAPFYTGTPAQLAALERATAEVVHRADPAALVLTPAVAGGDTISSLRFLDEYLSAGGGQYADALAYHDYNYPAESNIAATRLFRGLLAAHGLSGKPIWDTETGTDLASTTEADTAAYVARALVLDWALGLRRVFLYAYDGSFTGLDAPVGDGKKRDPTTLGPSGIAYRRVEGWLTGARMHSCSSNARNTWTCALRRPGGRRSWIVWATDGPRPFTIPASWHVARVSTLAGAAKPVGAGDGVVISTDPILLEP